MFIYNFSVVHGRRGCNGGHTLIFREKGLTMKVALSLFQIVKNSLEEQIIPHYSPGERAVTGYNKFSDEDIL